MLADGTMLLLDETGNVHAETTRVARPTGSGIAGLLDDSPTDLQRLLAAVQEYTGTVLASATGSGPEIVALGDHNGFVRTIGGIADSASLHTGPVHALAALSMPLDDKTAIPLIYSGGADGCVRAWSPGHAAMAASLLHRSSPVVCLDAAITESGPCIVVAWGDGVVQHIQWDTGAQHMFRPGPPVRAVALDRNGRVFIGMDEALACLTPRRTLSGDSSSQT
ncbi:hypothetical protein [Streptomyces atroolivaceus]|uniref:hypothetical protein n=1 Tax=Streptomyces atroolivaceus TaxID=66869 RepID=UPI0037AAB620